MTDQSKKILDSLRLGMKRHKYSFFFFKGIKVSRKVTKKVMEALTEVVKVLTQMLNRIV